RRFAARGISSCGDGHRSRTRESVHTAARRLARPESAYIADSSRTVQAMGLHLRWRRSRRHSSAIFSIWPSSRRRLLLARHSPDHPPVIMKGPPGPALRPLPGSQSAGMSAPCLATRNAVPGTIERRRRFMAASAVVRAGRSFVRSPRAGAGTDVHLDPDLLGPKHGGPPDGRPSDVVPSDRWPLSAAGKARPVSSGWPGPASRCRPAEECSAW
ncbi:MAG: hypothetical protein QOF08_2826, partial [Gaiellales bacterium]|nr:hypothetical protein [Gaiellales bacterium]